MPELIENKNFDLEDGWRMVRSEPNAASKPAEIDWSDAIDNAVVPGTVASTLFRKHNPNCNPDCDYDDFDWWYECSFEVDSQIYHDFVMNFLGLATLASVWLNDEKVHESRNMFRTFRIRKNSECSRENKLTIVFRSLNRDLNLKRTRGKWKTRLIANQQLRWIRTTLLGRMSGWTPPIKPIGPWRPIKVTCCRSIAIDSSSVYTNTVDSIGAVIVELEATLVESDLQVEGAVLRILDQEFHLKIASDAGVVTIADTAKVGAVPLWHPNTYGDATLHNYSVSLLTNKGEFVFANGRLGFRSVEIDRSGGRVAFTINQQPIFARGACWSTNDIVSLVGESSQLRKVLQLTMAAGANMIRVGGTTVYECDEFYDICDELGLTVWQDFMFANMDYPALDVDFHDDVSEEIREQICRLRSHPCIAVYCGNSEVEQQAAMFGRDEEAWRSPLFYETIPNYVADLHRDIPYFPSSPCEGALPFHNSTGIAHYFGVGAYRQTLDDLDKSKVKFAAECLAFSNMPSDSMLKTHFGTLAPVTHSAQWKSGVPRDSGAGWDFEDVRDHYLNSLYGIDATQLRIEDSERYTNISQNVTGDIIELVFGKWRDPSDPSAGGLLWLLKDIVPGAGWGFIDSTGNPKPVYYFIKRSWAPTNLTLTDRGMDGLVANIINDSNAPVNGTLRVQALSHSGICIADNSLEILVRANSNQTFSLDSLFGRFIDHCYRYRFGPAQHNLVVASLHGTDNVQLATSCFYPLSRNIGSKSHAEISVRMENTGTSGKIRISSDTFLQRTRLNSTTHQFSDNYFDIAPGATVLLDYDCLLENETSVKISLSALNLSDTYKFSVS